MPAPAPNLFDYTDYQEYLRAWFAHKREQNPAYSFQVFSHKARFKSRSYIQFVLKGKRPLTVKSIPKVARALELSAKQTQYLEAMVFFKENPDHEARMRHLEVMQKLGKSSKINRLQASKFEYLKQWYIAPIREIICTVNFKSDYAALGRMLTPAISPKQAREAVETLVHLKLVRKKGIKYEQVGRHIKAAELIESLAIRSFQKQSNSLAQGVHERIPRPERDLSTVTLSTNAEGFKKIRELCRDFRNDVIKIVEESEEIDRVYQLNLQFFPVSKNLKPTTSKTGGKK